MMKAYSTTWTAPVPNPSEQPIQPCSLAYRGPVPSPALDWHMTDRPFVLLRCAMSVDGYIGDGTDTRVRRAVLADLVARGLRRLMVEGGGSVHRQFLAAGLADELGLAVAPFFVGDAHAPRFVGDGPFPWDSRNRMTLAEVRRIGDV